MTITRQPTATEQQHYQRLQEIFTVARQRYLDAGAIALDGRSLLLFSSEANFILI
ncbi:hypothetical protein HC928_24830 [bacterium]|nr:hypothetical protein [bacterium]